MQTQKQEDIRYLQWINNEAIPLLHKNIDYFEQLANTIRTDIVANEYQQNAARIMAEQGQQTNIEVMTKLRGQMEDKLKETLVKLERQNKNVTGLYKLRNEYMIKICLLYTSPSPRDRQKSRMPSSA